MARNPSTMYCLQTWIVLSLTAWIPMYLSDTSACPSDVNGATHLCLQGYHQQVPRSMKQLFMGADVEMIRGICSQLMASFQCAKDIRDSCPTSEYSQIELVFSDVNSMAELCFKPYFFDMYARNMFCYQRQNPHSERCYLDFMEVKARMSQGAPLTELCRHVETFLDCVESNIRLQCSEEAASIAKYLVRPSVKMDESCRNETLQSHKSTPPPTPEPQETYKGVVSASACLHTASCHWLGAAVVNLSAFLLYSRLESITSLL